MTESNWIFWRNFTEHVRVYNQGFFGGKNSGYFLGVCVIKSLSTFLPHPHPRSQSLFPTPSPTLWGGGGKILGTRMPHPKNGNPPVRQSGDLTLEIAVL